MSTGDRPIDELSHTNTPIGEHSTEVSTMTGAGVLGRLNTELGDKVYRHIFLDPFGWYDLGKDTDPAGPQNIVPTIHTLRVGTCRGNELRAIARKTGSCGCEQTYIIELL